VSTRRIPLSDLPFWPLCLSREEAARYVGVSPGVFDDEVARVLWPAPRRRGGKGGRLTWHQPSLDRAADRIEGLCDADAPDADGSEWLASFDHPCRSPRLGNNDQPPPGHSSGGQASSVVAHGWGFWVTALMLRPEPRSSPSDRPAPSSDRRLASPERPARPSRQSTDLARCGEPGDLAKAVLFLAADDSSYINAMELMVDGGLTGDPFGAPILRG
jgi:hypothetical protein